MSLSAILNWPRKSLAARRFRQAVTLASAPPSLEFGSQARRDGWITVDAGGAADIHWNLQDPLPLPDRSVRQIYTSHLLEHFSYRELIALLREFRRILVDRDAGGSLSVCVPDASIWIGSYSRNEKLDTRKFLGYKPATTSGSRIATLNYVAYMDGQHKHMFDAEELVSVLNIAGFSEAVPRDFDASLDLAERREQSVFAIAYR